jgi:predicted ATP-grasp superfamily ATP-dependent carboligase
LKDVFDGEDLLKLGLPLVVKPRKGAGNFGVEIIDTVDDVLNLRKRINTEGEKKCVAKDDRILIYDNSDPIVQEFIDGDIVDACAIANRGKVKAILTQVRTKTLPPKGGFGVMNRTVNVPEVRDMAECLLTDLGWHGVAQIEFKYDTKSKQYKLMEINPKFWGTLALSVAAGIDFPYLAYRMAVGEDVGGGHSFEENCVYRWVVPNELAHVLQSGNRRLALKRFVWDFFRPANYNLSFRDPVPMVSLGLKSINLLKTILESRT